MKMTKNAFIAILFLLTAASTYAEKITIDGSKSQGNANWVFEKQDDGMFFILGTYTEKLLMIRTNATVKKGAADTVTLLCNAVNENVFTEHRLPAGSSMTCKGNFHDVVSLYIAPQDFKNGAEGIYEFKPLVK
jgi:hypothetical protein